MLDIQQFLEIAKSNDMEISQTEKGNGGYKSIDVDELEQILGVELYLYQKLFLKMLLKTNFYHYL